MVTKRMMLHDQEEAFLLFGQHDKNLKELEKHFGVQIFVRPSAVDDGSGLTLAVRGKPRSVDQALTTLGEMQRRATRTRQQRGAPTESIEVPVQGIPEANGPGAPGVIYETVTGKAIRPQTAQQAAYVKAIQESDMVVSVGPAGTGKTFLAVACAMASLARGQVSKIVLTRPVVEAGEKLGFLPGDFYEKVHPYLKPLYDAFYNMVGAERFRELRDEETIEILPLAYMRGRTLEDAFIILDEGQNTTMPQMKMFLTRMGASSRMVITGDVTQIDLEKRVPSGLIHMTEVLKGVPGISFVHLTEQDVVRHPLVRKIIRAYDEWETKHP
jgi:phosphate starvation-inducible PhoH-like protein